MSKHLTIEEITPYFPYGLKYFVDYTDGDTDIQNTIFLCEDSVQLDLIDVSFKNEDCKPILFPLSCLDQEITVDSKKLIPSKELEKEAYSSLLTYYDSETFIDLLPDGEIEYWIMKKLFEWKIDVFNLIDQEKAVSVFDLESNPYE